MSYGFVQTQHGTVVNVGQTVVASGNLGSAVTAGNSLIAIVWYSKTGSVSTVSLTDTAGTNDVWTERASNYTSLLSIDSNIHVFDLHGAAAGTCNVQATIADAVNYPGIVVIEYSGITGAPVGAAVFNAQPAPGTGTDGVTSGAMSALSAQPALQLAFSVVIGASGPTAGTGFTDRGATLNYGGTYAGRIEDRRLTATTGVAGTFTGVNGANGHHTVTIAYGETAGFTTSLSGSSVTASAGTLTYQGPTGINIALSGASASFSTGTLGIGISKALSGQAMTPAVGSFNTLGTIDVAWDDIVGGSEDGYRVKWGTSSGVYTQSRDLPANTTSYQIQALTLNTTYYYVAMGLVSGVEQTSTSELSGIPDPGGIWKAISGTAVTASAGTIVRTVSGALSGSAVAAQSGTITYTSGGSVTVPLSGTALSVSQSSLGSAPQYGVSGSAVTSYAGTISVSIGGGTLTLPLTGAVVSASAGALTFLDPNRTIALTGQAMTTALGTMTLTKTDNPTIALSGIPVAILTGRFGGNVPGRTWWFTRWRRR